MDIQEQYELRVKRYSRLLNGVDENGLICKIQIYRSLIQKHHDLGERLRKIEPLLPFFVSSIQQDVHLSLAKFFEDAGYGIRNFLRFCSSNYKKIHRSDGQPLDLKLLKEQEEALDVHIECTQSIKGRRDKVFAHADKKYLDDPELIYSDYPLSDTDVIDLANALISIIQEHEQAVFNSSSFHVAEFVEISVDNMIRNLEAGRKLNFPNQDLG